MVNMFSSLTRVGYLFLDTTTRIIFKSRLLDLGGKAVDASMCLSTRLTNFSGWVLLYLGRKDL